MHCLIFCVGTDGDCFPLFTLARTLRSRGHRVTVMAPPIYSGIPVLEDIGFEPLCTGSEYECFIADAPRLAGRYGLLFSRPHAICWNLNAWNALARLNARDLLILAPDQPFFWADVAARLAFPCASARFQVDPPPPRNSSAAPERLPWGNVQQYLAGALAVSWYEAAAQAGIPRNCASLANLSRERRHIPAIALWPDWFVRESPQLWDVRSFGFLLPDPAIRYGERAGIPPMKGHAVFKRGLADRWTDRFCATSIEACRELGMRGLFLGGPPPCADIPPEISWSRFIPLHRALENARVIVHNGGIGTAAAAIRCGVPQIVVPQFLAQPSIAEWVRRLGAGAVLTPDRYTPDRLCRRIERLAGNRARRTRLLELSARSDSRATSLKICEFLESLAAGAEPGGSRTSIAAPAR